MDTNLTTTDYLKMKVLSAVAKVIAFSSVLASLSCSCTLSVGYAQCPSVPAAPSCPSSSTVMSINGGSTKLDLGKTYTMSGTSYNASNMDQSGSGSGTTSIYICNGQTITINQVNTQSSYTYYVLRGGTLNLDGNFNGSTFYIYGTVNYTGAGDFSYQTNGQQVYIGRTGYLNLAGKTLTMNSAGGRLINEGFIYAGNLKANNGVMCINNSGCTQFDDIAVNDVTNYIVNDNLSGYVYYKNTTKPSVNRNLTASSSLRVCTRQASSWSFWNNANTSYSCTTPNWSCSNPLFISLTFFKAKMSENNVQVSWGTNLQKDTDCFLIERSSDGYRWEELTKVPAHGDKATYSEYNVTDPAPRMGDNYYRLTEVENSGSRKVYAVDYVRISTEEIPFQVYPNPSNGSFSVYLGDAFPMYDVQILDLVGMKHYRQTLQSGKNDLALGLPSGMYLVQANLGPEVKVLKIQIF